MVRIETIRTHTERVCGVSFFRGPRDGRIDLLLRALADGKLEAIKTCIQHEDHWLQFLRVAVDLHSRASDTTRHRGARCFFSHCLFFGHAPLTFSHYFRARAYSPAATIGQRTTPSRSPARANRSTAYPPLSVPIAASPPFRPSAGQDQVRTGQKGTVRSVLVPSPRRSC